MGKVSSIHKSGYIIIKFSFDGSCDPPLCKRKCKLIIVTIPSMLWLQDMLVYG